MGRIHFHNSLATRQGAGYCKRMSHTSPSSPGNYVYHGLNRAATYQVLFRKPANLDGNLTQTYDYPGLSAATRETVYRNTNSTGRDTTSYSYTWSTGNIPQSITTTLPLIGTSQNGPGGSAYDVTTQYFDNRGRPTWSKNADGFINYTQYDTSTGAVTETIVDEPKRGQGRLFLPADIAWFLKGCMSRVRAMLRAVTAITS